MSKIYNIAFRMGVLFNILLWTILNVLSLTVMKKRAEEITFDSGEGNWGIPFDWNAKYFVIEGAGAILNIIVYVACGFFFGFLFKFVWSELSQRRTELK